MRELDVAVRLVFFFFQAEDGIRDVAVTGVQTCALPISPPSSSGSPDRLWANAVYEPWRAGSATAAPFGPWPRSEEHTSELQSRLHLVCRLLLEKKKKNKTQSRTTKTHRLYECSTESVWY